VRPEERQLLARHCAGDPDAFGALVACYRAPIYGYLVRRGVEREVRDDLFQEIFLRIHRAAASYREDAPLHPWLFTIVANTVRSHFRKLRVRRLVFAEASPTPRELASTEPDGREVVEAREAAARIEAGLARLPETQREAVLLCCVEKLSHAEVGQILGVPAGTVRTRLARGRARLARLVARQRSESETCE
jgi:RNA polymerase sigma-70 factor (ECF subfamily)